MNALRSHRFRNQAYALLCLIVLLMPVRSGAATPGTERVVLKLGTVAPNGSSVHKIFLNMGAKWAKVPNGAELRIYPGAIAGGEADMVRKMKIGQLDAAGITANGLADIDPAVQSLQGIPMLFRSLKRLITSPVSSARSWISVSARRVSSRSSGWTWDGSASSPRPPSIGPTT